MTTESPSAAKNRKRFSAKALPPGLKAGGEDFPFDGVFIFRETAALSTLLPGLEMDGAFIRVDRRMKTNLPGVFAAGDCTGQPLQVAKAVGEGCVAAISAATT